MAARRQAPGQRATSKLLDRLKDNPAVVYLILVGNLAFLVFLSLSGFGLGHTVASRQADSEIRALTAQRDDARGERDKALEERNQAQAALAQTRSDLAALAGTATAVASLPTATPIVVAAPTLQPNVAAATVASQSTSPPQPTNSTTSAPVAAGTAPVPTTPPPSVQLTPTPQVATSLIWQKGSFGQWPLNGSWKVGPDGQLTNDGSESFRSIGAPSLPPGPDYILEAQITKARHLTQEVTGFGFYFRREQQASYELGIGFYHCCNRKDRAYLAGGGLGKTTEMDENNLSAQDFEPGTDPHIYRLVVHGNNFQLFIGDATAPLIEGNDKNYNKSREVGLWSRSTDITVDWFKITPLF